RAGLPVLVQVVEKREDNLSFQVCNAEGRRLSAGLLFDILKQQTKGVAIAGERLRTRLFMKLEMLSEEILDQRSDQRVMYRGHCSPPVSAYCLNLSPAAVNNSGVAVRYQQLSCGLRWPR